MNPSDFQTKNERTKKYSAFDINCIYQNTTAQAKPTQKSRYGLQRVGQIQGTRRTPKASWVPSVQAESGMQMRSVSEEHKDRASSSSTNPAFSQTPSQKSTDLSSLSWRKVVTSSLPGDKGMVGEDMDTGRVQSFPSPAAWMESRRLKQETMAAMANKSLQNAGAADASKTTTDINSGELVSKSGPPQSLRLQPNIPNKFLNSNVTASNSSGTTTTARIPFSQTAVSTGKDKATENASETRSVGKNDIVSSSGPTSTLTSKSNSLITSLLPDGSDHTAHGMSTADYFSSGWAAMSNEDDEPYMGTSITPNASSSEVIFTTSSSSAAPLAMKDGSVMTCPTPDTTALHIHQQAYNLQYQQPQTSEHFQSMAYLMNAGSSHQMNPLFSATSQHFLSLQTQTGAFYSGEPDKSAMYVPSTLSQIHPLSHGDLGEIQHSSAPAPLLAPSWPVSAPLRHSSTIGNEWASNPMVSSYAGHNNIVRSSYMNNRYVDNEDRSFHETHKQQAYREAVRKGKFKKMQGQEMQSETETNLSSDCVEKPSCAVSSNSTWHGSQGSQAYENVSSQTQLSIPSSSIVSSSNNVALTMSEGSRVVPVTTQTPSIHEVSGSHQSLHSFCKNDSESIASQRFQNEALQSSNIRSSKTSLASQDSRSRNPSTANKSQSRENYGNSSFDRSNKKLSNYSSYDRSSQYVSQESGQGRQFGYRNDHRRQLDYYEDGYYQDKTRSNYRQQGGGDGSGGQYYNKCGTNNASYDNSGFGFYHKASARSLRDEYANEYYHRYGNVSYQQSRNSTSDNRSATISHGKEGIEPKGTTIKPEKSSSNLSSRDKVTADGANSKAGRANYNYEEFGEVWIDEGDHNIPTKGVHRQNYGGNRSGSRYSSSLTRGAASGRGGRVMRGAIGSSYQRGSPDKHQRQAKTNESYKRQESPHKGSSKYDERQSDDSQWFHDGRHESEDNTRSSTASGRLINPMQEKHISTAIQSSFHHISQATPHSSQVVPLLTETECRSLNYGKHKVGSSGVGGSGSGSGSGSGAYSGDNLFTSSASHSGRGQYGESNQRKNAGQDSMTKDAKFESHSYGSSSYREEDNSTVDKQTTMRSQYRPRTSREGRGAFRGNGRSQMFETGPNTARGHVRQRVSGSSNDNRRGIRGTSEEKGKAVSDDDEAEEFTLWETASEGSDLSGGIHNSNEAHKTSSNALGSQRPTIDNDPSGKSSFPHRNHHPRGGSGSSGSTGMTGGNTGSTCDPGGKSSSTSVPGTNKSESDSRNNQGNKGNSQRNTNSHAGNSSLTGVSGPLSASQQNNSATSASECVSNANHKESSNQRPPRIKIHVDTSAYSNVVLADSLPQVTEEELYLEAISNAVDCDLIQSDVLTTVENVLGFQEVLSKATKRNRKRQEEQAEQQRLQVEKEQQPLTSPSPNDSEKSHHRMKVQEKGGGNEVRSKNINKRETGCNEPRASNSSKKDPLSKETGKSTFSMPRPPPIGPPTPLLDAEELLSVQPHVRHHNVEGITISLPPRLAKHHHQTNLQCNKPDRKSFKNSFYQVSNDLKQSPSSTSSHSQMLQTKPPSNDLISIDEWKSTEVTSDSKSSIAKPSASLELPPMTIAQEFVSISTSAVYETSRPIVSHYDDVVTDNSIIKESRSTTERVVWEFCETLMGSQTAISTSASLTIPLSGPHTLSENGDQNSRNATQRARSTSASTCKSATSIGSLSHGVSAGNFGGTNNSSNGQLSPTLGNTPSNICKVKPQQQMIHEEESSFCVNLNETRDRDVNTLQNEGSSTFQISVSGQLPPPWSGIDNTNSGTSTDPQAVLSIGSAIQALHLEEAPSEQVDVLTKASLLELHSEIPGVQSLMEQMAKFNASHGVLFDGSELYSGSTYVVTYPNTMLNPEYPPGLSTEVVWPNAGLDAFQCSTSKSIDINTSVSRMNFLGNMDPSLSFSAANNAMVLSSNSPATVSPSAVNATTAYPSIVNMGSNGTSLLTGMEFSPLLPHQVANSPFLATLQPQLGPNQLTNVAAAYQPHLHHNSAHHSAGLNPIFQSGGLNAGFGGPTGAQLDVSCGSGNPASTAGMQHFYAMLQQQPQLPSAAACPNVAGLMANFSGQPLISPAGAANHSSLINAHPNAFLRQDSQSITNPPSGPSNTPQHSALFMYNPQAAPPHVSLFPTAAPNTAPPAARTNFLGSGFTHPVGLHAMHGAGAMVHLGSAAPTTQHGARGTSRFTATAAAGVSVCDYQNTHQSMDMLPIAGSGTAALFAPSLNLYSATPTLHAPVSAPSLFSSASGFPFKALPAPHAMPPQSSMLSAAHPVLGNYLQHQHPIASNLHSQYNKTLHSAYSTIRPSLTPASLLNPPTNFLASGGGGARLAAIPGPGPQMGHQTFNANQSINILTNASGNQGRTYNSNSLLPSTSSSLNYDNQHIGAVTADVLPHIMPNDLKQMVVQMSRFRPVNSGRLNSASLLPSYLGNTLEVSVPTHQTIHNSQLHSANTHTKGASTHKRYQNNYHHRLHSNTSSNNNNESSSHRESAHTTTTVSTMSMKTSGSHNTTFAETMRLEKGTLESENQNTAKSLEEDVTDVPSKASFGAVDETRDESKTMAIIDPPSVVVATSSSLSHPSAMSILTAPLQPTILRNGLSE